MESDALGLVLRKGIYVHLNAMVLPVSEIEIAYYLDKPDPIITVRFSSAIEASTGTYLLHLPSTEIGPQGFSVPAVPAPVEAPRKQGQSLRHVCLKL